MLLTHAGTEMGQGLHTKCIQVAAQVFGIPVTDVHIAETASDRVHNTSPTAASVGSDLNGMATLDACEQIQARLRPLYEQYPDLPFRDISTSTQARRITPSAAISSTTLRSVCRRARWRLIR